ncbi:NADP-dependent oxidoreductase [Novipirellula sp. SH528]|uniref:NADP-dependent oxidoreductase n=1 Tax=Novipirellula sp. SH528 TaxID=3454466 RepID=UPI003FA07C8B
MPDSHQQNRRIVLNSRPDGAPKPDNFRLETVDIPELAAGEVLLRTEYLSLDPYMRGRMNDGPSYAPPVGVGDVMVGGTVSRVEQSKNSGFAEGDLVLGYSGWQDIAVSDGTDLIKLDAKMSHPSWALGVLGMPGFTAYMGLLEIGQPKPGETVVVAAATGAVGSVVGQIAKLKGCRVVGVAGGAEKCRIAREELGFDECIDHRASDFAEQLAAACTDGIDVYFESVGGKVFDAVIPLLNVKARIPLCGLIANYNDTEPPAGPDLRPQLMMTMLVKRIKMQGFIIFDDYGPRYNEFVSEMEGWVREGKVQVNEDIVEGLENAPEAFMGLLKGNNSGKLVIRV